MHGMMRQKANLHATVSGLLAVASLLGLGGRIAKAAAGPLLDRPPVPELNVRLYSFHRLHPLERMGAELIAAQVLRPARIKLNWIDCTAQVFPAACLATPLPNDLVVRFLAKAPPGAKREVLATTTYYSDHGAALIFYDRVVAMRGQNRFVMTILGRVIAHELIHLLLPRQGHSDVGLMRKQWGQRDLEFTAGPRLALSSRTAELVRQAVLRRALIARRGR